jgi:hypothetical protein
MALCKLEAAQARSDLTDMKTEITDLVNQTIQQSLKGIIQEVHNQSASTFLTATLYRKDMTNFHDRFKSKQSSSQPSPHKSKKCKIRPHANIDQLKKPILPRMTFSPVPLTLSFSKAKAHAAPYLPSPAKTATYLPANTAPSMNPPMVQSTC